MKVLSLVQSMFRKEEPLPALSGRLDMIKANMDWYVPSEAAQTAPPRLKVRADRMMTLGLS